jgi:flavodoxin
MFGEPARPPGKILVVYYSMGGNTARVARDIARLTGADIERLRDPAHSASLGGYLKAVIDAVCEKPAQLGPLGRNPRDYALTIIGTPVWARHITPAVRAYLQRCKGDIQKVAFFVTSGDTAAGKVIPEAEALVGRKGLAQVGFSAVELGDRARYEARLASFVRCLQHCREPSSLPRGAQPGLAIPPGC